MRSDEPMPGNPWPHDMVIAVEDDPNNLLQLLFIRSAWGIAQDLPIPALVSEPDPGASAMPSTASREEWGERWRRQWERAWDWYLIRDSGEPVTPEILRAISVPGAPLHPAFPPFWTAEYGEDGLDRDAVGRWQLSVAGDRAQSLEQQPERISLPALIDAWEAGLELVTVLPYAGYFALRLSPRHLVVSKSTRAEPDRYSRALSSTQRPTR